MLGDQVWEINMSTNSSLHIHGTGVCHSHQEGNQSIKRLEWRSNGTSHRRACFTRWITLLLLCSWTFVAEHEIDQVCDDVRPLQHALGCSQTRGHDLSQHIEEAFQSGPAPEAVIVVENCHLHVHEGAQYLEYIFDSIDRLS